MCSACKSHCTVHSKLEVNEQTSNENNAINYWRQLLRIEGKGFGWVKVSIGETGMV